MTEDFNTLLKLFIKEHNITHSEEEIEEILKLYFESIRTEIESDNLPQIRLKYFGTFRPMFGKLKHLQKNINWDKFNTKEKERYERIFKNLDELLKTDQDQSKSD